MLRDILLRLSAITESLPNITGSIGDGYNWVFNNGKGALISHSFGDTKNISIYSTGNINNGMLFDASHSSEIYQSNAKVRPESYATKFYIKA